MSLADNRGFLPKTRLNGDRPSADFAGVILDANYISVSSAAQTGADGLELRIFNSYVNVLC